MKKETIDGIEWVIDDDNNRVSIRPWRTEAQAIAMLESLEDCSRCSDCSDCSGCSDCSDCSGCSRCLDCSGCSRCSGCSDCSGCSALKNASPVENTNSFEVLKIENIHKKIYEVVSQPDALNMSNWHTCETTHCRAGWVVTLAGEPGKALEKKTSTLFAAMQIYEASGYLINPCRFYDANNAALEDMKRLAELES